MKIKRIFSVLFLLFCALAWFGVLDAHGPANVFAAQADKPLASGREIVGTRKQAALSAGAQGEPDASAREARAEKTGGERVQKSGKRSKEKKGGDKSKAPGLQGGNVYAGQPALTQAELNGFLVLLPKFRSWARSSQEDAHPVLKDGKPDFFYSPKSAQWVQANGWEPRRFFCVMGKLAAALVIVEEGNDFKGTRPADMPAVSAEELDLARRHLGELLRAGESSAVIR